MLVEAMHGKKIGVVMSSSFFGFFAHAGFLSALRELGIPVAGYAGTSAGALAGAFAATGMEPSAAYEMLMNLQKEDFWDPDYRTGLRRGIRLFRGWTGLLQGNSLRKLLADHLPVLTFEECRTSLCIVATNLSKRSKQVFSEGSIIDAVHASSAVPGLFQAVEIEGEYFVDGGLVTKAPVLDLYRMLTPDVLIVHYIPSKDLSLHGHAFLRKTFTAYRISNLATTICRHREYELECEYVRHLGCRVIEITPPDLRIGPRSLAKGGTAFAQAAKQTKQVLFELDRT